MTVAEAGSTTSQPTCATASEPRQIAGKDASAFSVLGACGHPRTGKLRVRVRVLHAIHRARQEARGEFLASLDTSFPPWLTVCDVADEIRNAVRAVWPSVGPSLPLPLVAR